MHSTKEMLLAIRSAKLADYDAWRGRLVVWFAADAAGFVVVVFAKLTEHAHTFFFSMQKSYWWIPLIITPLAGMVIVWVTMRWFAGVSGSGIPQTIAALNSVEAPVLN